MNVENIRRVADAIEKHEIKDLGFNMRVYGSSVFKWADHTGRGCGTTACIAGWAAIIGGFRSPETIRDRDGFVISKFAQDFLDIGSYEESELFEPDVNREEISAEQAVRTLRHLADTGRVEWDLPEQAP